MADEDISLHQLTYTLLNVVRSTREDVTFDLIMSDVADHQTVDAIQFIEETIGLNVEYECGHYDLP